MNTDEANTVPRERYLSRLRELRGFPAIKVMVGIRRCGKTTIMMQFMEEVLASGVPESKVYWADLESLTSGFDSPRALMDDILARVGRPEGAHVFLDEVQALEGWEAVVSTLHGEGADVYVTGSDSRMLSSELSTRLSGRAIEIRVAPLTFSEYLMFRSGGDTGGLLRDYIRHGGFPSVALLEEASPRSIPDMLTGIYNTVCMSDVVNRNRIRDSPLLPHITMFLMRNVGNRTSVRSITRYLGSKGIRVSADTVDSYVSFLEQAMLFSRPKRLDSRTREYLITTDKLYAADLGIRHCLVPFTPADIGGIMENVVYNELMSRHGEVAVCDVDGMEVDFVAEPMGRPSYYQVCADMSDPTTLEREVRSLKALRDNYPKTVITWEPHIVDDIDGIRVVGLAEWLLEGRDRGRPPHEDHSQPSNWESWSIL